MVKQLKRRFVAIAMLATFAAFVIIGAGINIVQRYSIDKRVDGIIDLIIENGGELPFKDEDPKMPDGERFGDRDPAKDDSEAGEGKENNSSSAPAPGNDSSAAQPGAMQSDDRKHGDAFMTGVPFETRFITAVYENGEFTIQNKNHLEEYSLDYALESLTSLSATPGARGYSGYFRYAVFEQDGKISAILVDCYSQLESAHSLLLVTVAVTAAGLLFVFCILMILSDKIIKPFADNYNKQRTFVTDASHELKTPITVIAANTDVLELTSGENEWTKSIKTQTERLTRLVKSLIELSKTEEDVPEDEAVLFSLSDTVNDTADSFRVIAESAGKTLSVDTAPGINITGMPEEIIRLTGILIDNAIKYSDERGAVTVLLREKRRRPVLTVSNTVSGFDPEALPRLFDRFYRQDASRSRETGGYGIGLSIAKGIVERRKGKIKASLSSENILSIVCEL